MPKFIDRTGTEIGEVKFLKRSDSTNGHVEWVCLCTCGNIFISRAEHVMRAKSCPQCGRRRQANKISKHGDYKEPLYRVWSSMKQRCNNPKAQEYKNYGGRGILVCKEWEQYDAFKKWSLNSGYEKGLSIDRINNSGNYEPSNCRWVDMSVQALNKRSNRIIEYEGLKKPVTEMARIYGLRPVVVERRLIKGWTVERALKTPLDVSQIHLPKKTTTQKKQTENT